MLWIIQLHSDRSQIKVCATSRLRSTWRPDLRKQEKIFEHGPAEHVLFMSL